MKMSTQYSLFIAPKKFSAAHTAIGKDLHKTTHSKIWGGPHITMMSFLNKDTCLPYLRELAVSIATVLQGQIWVPSDFNLTLKNENLTIVIKSKTLSIISEIIRFHNLSPKDDFHITLGIPKELPNFDYNNVCKYLQSLDWCVTIVKKNDAHVEWLEQYPLRSLN